MTMRRQIHALTATVTFATLVIAASQASSQTPDGATLFKERTCIACHGADAKTPILPIYPKLAGQGAAYTFQQMQDIKSGARNNGNTAAMKGIMFLVNEEEMKILSEYLASLQP
jgi:cytochrome c